MAGSGTSRRRGACRGRERGGATSESGEEVGKGKKEGRASVAVCCLRVARRVGVGDKARWQSGRTEEGRDSVDEPKSREFRDGGMIQTRWGS